MSDGFCRNCGHSNHQDALQEDFCYKVTPGPDGGLCGCQLWDESFEEDYEDSYADEDDKDYQDAQEGLLPAHADHESGCSTGLGGRIGGTPGPCDCPRVAV